MAQRLHIILSEQATLRYLELARAKTEGEINEDCEPSGATIQLDIWLLENAVWLQDCNSLINIGEANVDLVGV